MRPFGDFPPEFIHPDNASIVLLPVPYDKTSTYGKGADKGPEALLEASYNLEFYDIETGTEVFRQGIFTAPPIKESRTPEKMVEAVYATCQQWLSRNKFVVVLGGEHSVSEGTIRAHAEHYPGMCVLQLDAHADLRQSYRGSKHNHACIMARAAEICPVTQVGIRSLDITETPSLVSGRVFFAEQIHSHQKWIREAINTLSEQVYVTIDLDVFDPSVLPSTGTPEPGGLSWYMVIDFLREVVRYRKVVGFDVVELCPNPREKSSDFTAAKLVYKFLSLIFAPVKNLYPPLGS